MRNRLSGLLFMLWLVSLLAACSPAAGEAGDAGRGVAAGQPNGATVTPAPAAANTMATAVAAGIAATLDTQATSDAAVAITPDAQPTAAPASPSPAPPTATSTPTATATPSPSPTITASPTPCQWALTANINAYIRRGPDEAYDILGSLTAGETTAIISRDASSSWWVIPFGGRDGWVADSVVTVNVCPSDVPVSTPPATPTPTTTPTPLPTATPAFNPPPVIAEVELVRKDHVPYSQDGPCDRGSSYTISALVSDASGVAQVTLQWSFQDYIYESDPKPGETRYWPSGDPQYGRQAMELLNDFDPLGQSLIGRYGQMFLVPFPLEYPIYDAAANEYDYLSRWVYWYIDAVDSAGKSWRYEGEPQRMFTCFWQ